MPRSLLQNGIVHHTYDPLLGYANDKCPLPGVQVWPKGRRWNDSDLRVMVLGGSTTMWPPEGEFYEVHLLGRWAVYLGEMFEGMGRKPIVFNAAACGYSTDQELLRLLRDGPGLSPHLVLSMSGVNDAGFKHSFHPYPMTHLFQSYVAQKLTQGSDEMPAFSLGVPWQCEPHVRWLRNVRLCRMIAKDLGAEYVAFLQPMLGISASLPTTDEERGWLENFRKIPCRNGSYFEESVRFYAELRPLLGSDEAGKCAVDLVDMFEGETAVWIDHAHPNDKGYRLMAQQVFESLKRRQLI